MNLRETIPSQGEIEEFLGRDFFPKYANPMTVAETIDMVQLQFGVPDDARQLPCPKAHGCDGTILEALTYFAMLRLEEKGFLVHTDISTYRWKSGVKWFGKVSQKNLNHLVLQLHRRTSLGASVEEVAEQFHKGGWAEDEILAAVHKFNLTKS